MFFEISMQRLVVLQPQKLHKGVYLTMALLTQLCEEVKNLKCSEDHGYYVTPTTIGSVQEGKVRSNTGAVVFPVAFKCIVFKPFKREILDGEVKKIVRRGCFISCGPLEEIFLHEEMMGGCVFHQNESTDSSFFKHEEGFEIRVGSHLRFRLLGLKWVEEQRTFKALGTINGHFLGCIN
eukprot:c20487_g1_i1 orf=363-899(-)